MSYDLTLQSSGALADPIRETVTNTAMKLAGRFCCESWAGEGSTLVTVAVSGADDNDLAKLYKGLVKLAKENELELFDPQKGGTVDLDTPGRYPSKWIPSGPVSGKSFNAKVKSFLHDYTLPLGFEIATKWTSLRRVDGLIQGVNFHPGRGRLAGCFNINFYWTFLFDGPSEAMDASITLVDLLKASGKTNASSRFDGWLATSPAKALERSFELARETFFDGVMPRFDTMCSIEGLVGEVEAGRLGVREAFGQYRTAENMAGCYRHLGRVEDGFRRLEAFFESWRAEIAALEIPERRPDDLRPHFTREEHLAYLEGEWKRGRTAFGR